MPSRRGCAEDGATRAGRGFEARDTAPSLDMRALFKGLSAQDVGNTLPAESVIPTVRRYSEDYDQYLIIAKVKHQMQVICSGMTTWSSAVVAPAAFWTG